MSGRRLAVSPGILIIAGAVLVMTAGCARAALQPGDPFAVSPSQGEQWNPDVSGSRVVWQDDRNGNWDIFLRDLRTKKEVQITTELSDQQHPAIDGRYVVWQDERFGNEDIFLYNIDTGRQTRITSDAAPQFTARISGDYVSWVDDRGGSWDIFRYNIKTERTERLATAAGHQLYPGQSGDLTSWVTITSVDPEGTSGNWDLCISDGKGEPLALTDDSAQQFSADLDGRTVVWHDLRKGNWDIWALDLKDGKARELSGATGDQLYPVVDGRFAAWADNRNGDFDIRIYDFEQNRERRITSRASDQENPAISDGVVVWQDGRTGRDQIWAQVLAAPGEAGRTGDAGSAATEALNKLEPSEACGNTSIAWLDEEPRLSEADAKALYEAKCSQCHSLDRTTIRQQSKGFRVEQWAVQVERMRANNQCPISPTEATEITAYMERTFR